MRTTLSITLFFLSMVYFSSCFETELFGPETSVFPPITSEGNQTLACKINGKEFVHSVQGIMNWSPFLCIPSDNTSSYRIHGLQEVNNKQVHSLNLYLNDLTEEGVYPIDRLTFSTNEPECNGSHHWLDEEQLVLDEPHEINIIRVDTAANILSGTFQFTVFSRFCLDTFRITDGRFDLKCH